MTGSEIDQLRLRLRHKYQGVFSNESNTSRDIDGEPADISNQNNVNTLVLQTCDIVKKKSCSVNRSVKSKIWNKLKFISSSKDKSKNTDGGIYYESVYRKEEDDYTSQNTQNTRSIDSIDPVKEWRMVHGTQVKNNGLIHRIFFPWLAGYFPVFVRHRKSFVFLTSMTLGSLGGICIGVIITFLFLLPKNSQEDLLSGRQSFSARNNIAMESDRYKEKMFQEREITEIIPDNNSSYETIKTDEKTGSELLKTVQIQGLDSKIYGEYETNISTMPISDELSLEESSFPLKNMEKLALIAIKYYQTQNAYLAGSFKMVRLQDIFREMNPLTGEDMIFHTGEGYGFIKQHGQKQCFAQKFSWKVSGGSSEDEYHFTLDETGKIREISCIFLREP